VKRIVFALVVSSGVAGAQGRPFSFTVPFPDGTPQTVARYDGGWGNGTFEPLGGDHIQQTTELDAPLGSHVLFMASGGLTFEGPTEGLAQRQDRHTMRNMESFETLVDVLRFSGWHLAVSGGVRHDFDGSIQALSRLSLSRTTPIWTFAANLYATKAISGAVQNPRDIPWADFTASVGATAKITSGFSLGVECVMDDTESLLWARGENGDAAIFLGPLASFTLPGRRARLTVSGGPILQTGNGYAPIYSTIGKYSMPLHSGQAGYTVRLAVSVGL